MKLTTASRPLSFSYAGLTIIAAAAAVAAIVIPLSRRATTSLFPRDGGFELPPRAQQPAALHDRQQSPNDLNVAKIVFSRGDFIYLKDLQSGNQTKLTRGDWPEISPDGSKLLFKSAATEDDDAPRPLQVFDLATKRVEELTALAGLDPRIVRWSHDGTKIAFDRPDDAFSFLDATTGVWRTITACAKLQTTPYESKYFYISSWAPDDKSILIHSHEFLYEVNLDGEVIWKLPIGEFNISSATRFSLSSDKKLLLFDNDREGGEHDPVNGVVSILEIASGKITTRNRLRATAAMVWFRQ